MGESSPRALARVAGAFYLLTIVLGGLGETISGGLVVSGDPAATAANLLAREPQLRLAFACYMVEMAANTAMTGLFYVLLRPVGRTVALLAALMSLVGIAIKTMSRLFLVAPLVVLGDAAYLEAFTTEQRQALGLVLLRVNAQGAGMGLVFFGFNALLEGYLIFRSTFLPRILGVLGMLGGLGWLTFLVPPFAGRVYTYVLAVGLLGAAAQVLWFLAVGVNEQRWREQAGRAAARDAG